MPLYVGDYLADTAGLSAEEHGAYLLLIMNYWTNGGPLPDDDARLSRIAACDPARWPSIRSVVSRFFKITRGLWKHKRIDAEIARAEANIEAKRRGGKARAAKELSARAEHMHQHNGQHNGVTPPSPLPLPKKKDIKNLSLAVKGALRARKGTRVDYSRPENRQVFARQKIGPAIGWETMMAAEDPKHPEHGNAAVLAEAEARRQGVMWRRP